MPPKHQRKHGLNKRHSAPHFRLKGFAVRLAKNESLTSAELANVLAFIAEEKIEATAAVSELWVHVSDNVAVELMALYAVALRRSSVTGAAGLAEDVRACFYKLRTVLALNIVKALRSTFKPDATERQVLLFQLLARTQVLRCYASLLAEAAQQLLQRPSRRNVETSAVLLSEVDDLLYALAQTPTMLDWTALSQPAPRPDAATGSVFARSAPFTKQDFADELASGMRAGYLLDVWATCFLELVRCGEWSRSEAAWTLQRFAQSCWEIYSWLQSKTLQVRRICEPTPRLLYLLTAHVVRLLALIDGGSVYGTPPDAPEVPAPSVDGAIVRRSGGGELDAVLLKLALALWDNFYRSRGAPLWPGAASLPPFNLAATFDICIRVLEGAVLGGRVQAAGAAPAQHPQQRHQQHQQPRRRSDTVLLQHDERGQVANKALLMGMQAMWGLIHERAGDPRRTKWLQRFWNAYVHTVEAAMDSLSAAQHPSLLPDGSGGSASAAAGAASPDRPFRPIVFGGDWAYLPILTMGTVAFHEEGLASQPGPETEAALTAGILGCMERLTRLCHKQALLMCGPAMWLELFMFGPVGEMAALIASVAKRIRSCVGHLTAVSMSSLPAAERRLLWAQASLPTEIEVPLNLLETAFGLATQTRVATALGYPSAPDHPSGTPCSAAAAPAVDGDGDVSRPGLADTAGSGGGAAATDSGSDSGAGASRGAGDDVSRSRTISSQAHVGAMQFVALCSFTAAWLLPMMPRAVALLAQEATAGLGYQPALRHNFYGALEATLNGYRTLLACPDARRRFTQPSGPDMDLLGLLGDAAQLLAQSTIHIVPAASCAAALGSTVELACCVLPDVLGMALRAAPAAVGACPTAAGEGSGGAVGLERGGQASLAGPMPDGGEGPGVGSSGGGRDVAVQGLRAKLLAVLGPAGPHPHAGAMAWVDRVIEAGNAGPSSAAPDVARAQGPLPGLDLLPISQLLLPANEARKQMADYFCWGSCVNLAGPSELALLQRKADGAGIGSCPLRYCDVCLTGFSMLESMSTQDFMQESMQADLGP